MKLHPRFKSVTLTLDSAGMVPCCCGGDYSVAYDDDGEPCALHSDPPCDVLHRHNIMAYLTHQRLCPNGYTAGKGRCGVVIVGKPPEPSQQCMWEKQHDGPCEWSKDFEPLCEQRRIQGDA